MEDKIMKTNQEKTKKEVEAFVASLMPDSDKKMGAIASTSFVVALLLCFWATTYEALTEDIFFEKTDDEKLIATLNVTEKKEEKKIEEKAKQKHKVDDTKRKRMGGGGKPKGRGNPKAELSRSVIHMLASQTKNASAGVYDLMKQTFAKDIDKVLKATNGLQVTGKTHLGERRGKADGGFNAGVAEGGSGGIGGLFDDMFGGSAGKISTKAMKGHMKTPSERDIDFGPGNTSRSAVEIMKVVRNRTPGLRHVYNKHLKKNPGFQGKVTLRFTIAPGGEIIRIEIVSSTTGYSAFDEEIMRSVGRWTFSKVKSGNTTVIIPFTFTE